MRLCIERDKDLQLEMLLWAYAPHGELLAGSAGEYGQDYQLLIKELGVTEVGKFKTNPLFSYPMYGRLIISNNSGECALFYDDKIVDEEGKRLMHKVHDLDLTISREEEMAFFGDLIRSFPDQHIFLSEGSNVRYDANDINELYNKFVFGK